MSLKDWNAALKYCHLTLPAYESKLLIITYKLPTWHLAYFFVSTGDVILFVTTLNHLD